MPKNPILKENQYYTFRSYFEMPYEQDEILAEFNYSLIKSRLLLPKSTRQLERLSDLQQRLEESLLLVSLSSFENRLKFVLLGHAAMLAPKH